MTSPDLFASLASLGAELMVETLAQLAAGTATLVPQQDAFATHARPLTREDGQIDWTRPASEIDARFRGFQPWPGAFTTFRGKKLIVHGMRCGDEVCSGAPGEVSHEADALAVCCGDGSSVLLDAVQMEGKKRMSAAEFLRGHQVRAGERLG